jgi:hypothetical protein
MFVHFKVIIINIKYLKFCKFGCDIVFFEYIKNGIQSERSSEMLPRRKIRQQISHRKKGGHFTIRQIHSLCYRF